MRRHAQPYAHAARPPPRIPIRIPRSVFCRTMQWVADVIVNLTILVRDLVAKWWPSLVVIALVFATRKFPMEDRRPRLSGQARRLSSTGFAYFSIALLSLTASIAWTVKHGEPRPPWFGDDYGELLNADTFFHFRIANPPHPMAYYIEAMPVLQSPHYMAQYPPAPGITYAIARRIAGTPVIALWFLCAAAACAVFWAASIEVPFALAWLAGLLCAIHPDFLEWNSNYRGGALAALG